MEHITENKTKRPEFRERVRRLTQRLAPLLRWLALVFPPPLRQLLWPPKEAAKHIWDAISGGFSREIKELRRNWYELRQKKLPKELVESEEQKKDRLQQHVASTYRNLRYGLAFISFVWPLFLWQVGIAWYNVPQAPSMSEYYFAEKSPDGEGYLRSYFTGIGHYLDEHFTSPLFAFGGLDPDTPLRIWFVGPLFLLGFFLYLYKGFSGIENILLNVAGLSALGIALFPTEHDCGTDCHLLTLHGVFAIVAFVFLGLVALVNAIDTDTLRKMPLDDSATENGYRLWYGIIAFVMFGVPFAAWGATAWLPNAEGKYVFYIEWFGLFVFSLYWLIKSNELWEKRAEVRAVAKALPDNTQTPAARPQDNGTTVDNQVQAPSPSA